jgi:hypothetical protein
MIRPGRKVKTPDHQSAGEQHQHRHAMLPEIVRAGVQHRQGQGDQDQDR